MIENLKFEGDPYQLKTSIAPYIANSMYTREKECLEEERFRTLTTLARTLDDETLQRTIEAFKYKLTVE